MPRRSCCAETEPLPLSPVIPYVDLSPQNQPLRAEFEAALGRVLDSGAFVQGEEVAAFEEEFAAACGVPHAVAVSSGTAALHLALVAAGVGPGDEVIVPPFTFVATASAVVYAGATPVFADIEPAGYALDPAAVEAALTPRTRAVVPVHLYGQCADMEALRALAEPRGIALVEDAAQAHGAELAGRRAGALGDYGCFSFYPTKNLGALGEGGLVTTASREGAQRLRLLRDWGQEVKYEHRMLAFNARMQGFQGAVLRVKLPYLEAWTEARRALAARYAALLAEGPVAPPAELPGRRHVWHCYTVRVPDRARVQKALAERGVGTGIHYPIALHRQPLFAELGLGPGSFPEAERAAEEVLSLPLYPGLAPEAPDRVVAALREAISGR